MSYNYFDSTPPLHYHCQTWKNLPALYDLMLYNIQEKTRPIRDKSSNYWDVA